MNRDGIDRLRGADNRYMEIMNLCVLHLSDIERETGQGVDREELVQWYLEQKEMEFENEEDLEYERELIGKALNKLAKVGCVSRSTSSFPLPPKNRSVAEHQGVSG